MYKGLCQVRFNSDTLCPILKKKLSNDCQPKWPYWRCVSLCDTLAKLQLLKARPNWSLAKATLANQLAENEWSFCQQCNFIPRLSRCWYVLWLSLFEKNLIQIACHTIFAGKTPFKGKTRLYRRWQIILYAAHELEIMKSKKNSQTCVVCYFLGMWNR